MGQNEEPLSDPWLHIPANTAVLFEFPEPEVAWGHLATRSKVWKALRNEPAVERLHDLLTDAFDAPQHEAAIAPFCERPMLLAFDRVNAHRGNALFILAAKRTITKGQLITLFSSIDPAIINKFDKLDETRFELDLDSTIGTLHIQQKNDLLLISTDPELLNGVLADPSYAHREDIMRVRKTLGGGADAHAILDNEQAERFFDIFLHPQQQRQLQMPKGLAALDIKIGTEAIISSGIIDAANIEDIERLGDHGGPNRANQIVDRDASYLYSIHVEDAIAFTDQIISNDKELQIAMKEYRDSIFVDMQQGLASWQKGEVVIALNDNNPSVKWITMRALDGLSAKRAIDDMAEGFINAGKAVAYSVNDRWATYYFPEPLPVGIFGPAFNKINPTHVGIWGDLVLFTASENTLLHALSALENEQTLESEERANNQFENLPEHYRTLVWCDLARSKELASHYIDVNKSQGDTSTLDGLGTLALMVGGNKNNFHQISLQLEHASFVEHEESLVLWRSALPTHVRRKPDVLDDHTSAGRNILVQDDDHNLHFFSSSGEKLWERDIKESLIGGVHQVDRYKNGKLQMLFTTTSAIHLLDRNGNDVEGYPIRIKGGTNAPLALVDYDADQNFRILISDRNGGLHNFELSGKPVKGWAPIKLSSASDQAVMHIRIKTKDYLMVIEKNGTIQLLDRKGQPRHKPRLVLSGISDNDIKVHTALSIGECEVWWTDTTGQVWNGKLDGDPHLYAGGAWNEHFSLFTDLDEDGENDVIRSEHDSVNVRSSVLGGFRLNTIGNLTSAPYMFDFGKGKRGLVFQPTTNRGCTCSVQAVR